MVSCCWAFFPSGFLKASRRWQRHHITPQSPGDSGTEHTIGGALGNRSLAATTADAHAVDDVALLGLVSEAAGLVGARGARGTVDDVELTVLFLLRNTLSANVQRV